jgi:hypothetical protein
MKVLLVLALAKRNAARVPSRLKRLGQQSAHEYGPQGPHQ